MAVQINPRSSMFSVCLIAIVDNSAPVGKKEEPGRASEGGFLSVGHGLVQLTYQLYCLMQIHFAGVRLPADVLSCHLSVGLCSECGHSVKLTLCVCVCACVCACMCV